MKHYPHSELIPHVYICPAQIEEIVLRVIQDRYGRSEDFG